MKETDNILVVAIRLLSKDRSLRAFADIEIGGWIIHDWRILNFLWAVGLAQDMEGIEPGDFPIYQWQEIQQLIDNHVELETLRAVHNAKRIFSGTNVISEKK